MKYVSFESVMDANERDIERTAALAKQVCDYEETLFRIAYPQKFCSGSCRCYSIEFLKDQAKDAFHRYNKKPQESPAAPLKDGK
jgi:hypothetical protein